uniref:NADH dehydrogenase subunit 6 n=1 Tax=Romanomermis culicivorax TaxID=13658 RepID=A0A915J3E4_ROMCU
MLFIFVLTITELIMKVNFPHLLINNGDFFIEKFRLFGIEINSVLWTFLLSIAMLISLIILCLTAHLLIFHAR